MHISLVISKYGWVQCLIILLEIEQSSNVGIAVQFCRPGFTQSAIVVVQNGIMDSKIVLAPLPLASSAIGTSGSSLSSKKSSITVNVVGSSDKVARLGIALYQLPISLLRSGLWVPNAVWKVIWMIHIGDRVTHDPSGIQSTSEHENFNTWEMPDPLQAGIVPNTSNDAKTKHFVAKSR